MKTRNELYVIAIVLLLLGGCAGTQPPAASVPSSTVQTETPAAGSIPTEVLVQTPDGVAPVLEPQPKPAMSANRAVIALLDRAETNTRAGQRDAAGAALERALRIEPRNPWLWHELAQVRLAQGQYAQAITLAKKSNSFGSGQRRLQAENWQLIAQARVAQGDTAGAELASRQAAEILQ